MKNRSLLGQEKDGDDSTDMIDMVRDVTKIQIHLVLLSIPILPIHPSRPFEQHTSLARRAFHPILVGQYRWKNLLE